MNNCEKKLDALIDALGFDVETVMRDAVGDEEPDIFLLTKDYCVDYKLTKREDKAYMTREECIKHTVKNIPIDRYKCDDFTDEQLKTLRVVEALIASLRC